MSDITTLMMAAAGQGGAETDPNFNQTVLLLHGDGTNGAQNNTFLDSSSNTFTITRNGNTTQGTFSPFSGPDGYWSNFFDGTNDRLTIADNAALRPGTSAFTIEAWVYRAAAGAAHTIFAKGASTPTGFAFLITSSNTLRFTDTSTDITSTGTVAANTWVHVAAVREGTGSNQLKLYINGVQDGTGTSSTNFTQTEEARIGENRGATDDFNGYISNFRYVIGTALYTSGFTPSTSPLTTTSQGATSSQVELLTCQSNRFLDNSTNGFTISPVNNTSVQPFSPFAPSAAYDASVNGGSGYFDGTGDYLQLTANSNLDFGAGDFTFSAWIYPLALGSNYAILDTRPSSGSQDTWYYSWVTSTNFFRFYASSSLQDLQSTTAIRVNEWTHVACCRSGSTVRLFVNGVEEDSQTSTAAINSTSLFRVGAKTFSSSSLVPWNGYMSDIRLEASDLYTGNFSVPTAPADPTGSELCLSMQNAGIFDNTGKNNLETVGNAQVDTSTKKFGTGSMEFDGTGDWLKVPNSPDIQLGTGDFTIEFWVYLATGDTGSNRGLVAKGGASTGWLVSLNTTENVVFTYTTSTITSSGAITLDAWNHIAVVREGTGSNETKIYINGTNDGTGTVSTDFNQTEVMYIGANRAAGDPMKGYIDDLRITKGVARYTTTFTPPTAAFPDL